MASASLCLSDLMTLSVPIEARSHPLTLGHEGVGYIQAIHPSAEGKGFKVGDAVGFLYIIGCCFECAGCQIHNTQCLDPKSTVQIHGVTHDGFLAEYAVTDYHSAMILPSKMDPRKSSPLFCAGITGKAHHRRFIVFTSHLHGHKLILQST